MAEFKNSDGKPPKNTARRGSQAKKHEINATGGWTVDAWTKDVGPRSAWGLEAVVVLHQVFKGGFGPVALVFRTGLSGILDFVTKGIDRFRIILGADEGIYANLHRVVVGSNLGADIVHLGLNALPRVAVGEVPVRNARGHVPHGARTAAPEDFRIWLLLQRLAAEPARDNIDGDTPASQVIDGGNLFGQNVRMPGTGQNRGDDPHFFGRCQQRVADDHRLMLEFGTIAGGEANLRQGIFKAGLLGDLRQFAVVVDVPAGALLDIADGEATADVGYPLGEFVYSWLMAYSPCEGWIELPDARSSLLQ